MWKIEREKESVKERKRKDRNMLGWERERCSKRERDIEREIHRKRGKRERYAVRKEKREIVNKREKERKTHSKRDKTQ